MALTGLVVWCTRCGRQGKRLSVQGNEGRGRARFGAGAPASEHAVGEVAQRYQAALRQIEDALKDEADAAE
eukprot:15203014-Alexandrium_andersonii.AAC.1